MASGDPSSQRDALVFEELYAPLRRFAAVVGGRDIEPDDLLQEAVARALGKGSLHELNDPGAYLRRIIVRLVSNDRRHLAVVRRGLSRLMASEAGTVRDDYPSEVDDLLRLKPSERAVLYLSEVDGYRYSEIGALIGCSEAAARKRALRARRRLQAALVEEVRRG